jgi:hypothetical protein
VSSCIAALIYCGSSGFRPGPFTAQAQAQAVVDELLRLRQIDKQLDWPQCAVLVTQWQLLNPVRALLEEHSIPVSLMLDKDHQPPPFRIRENANLIATLKQSRKTVSTTSFWLNTYSVKGMKFSHMVILDGGWTKDSLEE